MVTQNHKIAERAFKTHHAHLLNYVHTIVERIEDCEDIAQEAFLRILESPTCINVATVKSLLFTIARNISYDFLRRGQVSLDAKAYQMQTNPRSVNDTESNLIMEDILKAERNVMNRMPEQRRNVYKLFRFEYLDAHEISSRLNISLKCANNHLFRSKVQVRECIKVAI